MGVSRAFAGHCIPVTLVRPSAAMVFGADPCIALGQAGIDRGTGPAEGRVLKASRLGAKCRVFSEAQYFSEALPNIQEPPGVGTRHCSGSLRASAQGLEGCHS